MTSNDEDQTSALVLERLAQITNADAQRGKENAQLLAVVYTLQEEVVSLRSGASHAAPGTYEADATASPEEGTTTVAATVDGELIVEDVSNYSLIAIVAPLVLQMLILSSVVSCVWHHNDWLKLSFVEHGIPIFGGLFCLDIAWVVFCMTGVMDLYVRQALVIMFCALLVVCNLCFFLFLIYHWWHKNQLVQGFNEMKGFVDAKIRRNVRIFEKDVVDVMAKVDAMYEHMIPNGDAVKKFFQNEGEWDSEDEDDPDHEDPQPPDERAKKLGPISITIVKAEGLVAADNKLPKMGGKFLNTLGVLGAGHGQGLSDPYCSVVVRLRKKACWQKTGYLKNTVTPLWKKDNVIAIQDFREGDVIKFKMWDDDSHESHLGIAHDDLLGKAQLNSSQVVENIGQGECELKLKLDNQDKKHHKVKLSTPPEGYGKMFVRIERISQTSARRSIAKAEAELVQMHKAEEASAFAVLEGEEVLEQKMKTRMGCC